jgi:hypothetical protein
MSKADNSRIAPSTTTPGKRTVWRFTLQPGMETTVRVGGASKVIGAAFDGTGISLFIEHELGAKRHNRTFEVYAPGARIPDFALFETMIGNGAIYDTSGSPRQAPATPAPSVSVDDLLAAIGGDPWDTSTTPDITPDATAHPDHTECADGCGLAVTHTGACLDKPGGRICCSHDDQDGDDEDEVA